MSYLGKDTELREALAQQQAAIDATKAQAEANQSMMNFGKVDGFMLALGIMFVLWMFRK